MKRVNFSLVVTFILALFAGILLCEIAHSGFAVIQDSDAYSSNTDETENTSVAQDSPENICVSGKININTADANTLMKLDGIGEVIAKRIISYRNKHGKFETIEQIMKVSGIGKKRFNLIKDYIIAE